MAPPPGATPPVSPRVAPPPLGRAPEVVIEDVLKDGCGTCGEQYIARSFVVYCSHLECTAGQEGEGTWFHPACEHWQLCMTTAHNRKRLQCCLVDDRYEQVHVDISGENEWLCRAHEPEGGQAAARTAAAAAALGGRRSMRRAPQPSSAFGIEIARGGAAGMQEEGEEDDSGASDADDGASNPEDVDREGEEEEEGPSGGTAAAAAAGDGGGVAGGGAPAPALAAAGSGAAPVAAAVVAAQRDVLLRSRMGNYTMSV